MKIKIISKTLEATFGLKLDSIHECCECPEEHKAQLKDSVWVDSEQQDKPVRCLDNEYIKID